MKYALWCLLLAIMLAWVTPGHAQTQTSADWGVAVFADGAQAVKVLTADGVSASISVGFPLTIGEFPGDPLVAISPDRRALAALDTVSGGRLIARIAANGSCCTTVRLAQEGTALAQIGGFSPNGRRFVVSYVTMTDADSGVFTSTVAVIDVEFGVVITTLDRSQIGGDYAWLRGWNDDGIGFVPLCYGCDDPPSGTLARWNPETGEITHDLGYESRIQDTLALTGETISVVRRPDYPLPMSGDAPNVVMYGARVIYYNPRDLEVDAVHWIADGWQVLVEHPNSSVVLDRAGVKRSVTTNDQFLVGTPDGWLGTRPLDDSGALEVVHHTLTNLSGTVIARFYHPIEVIQAPALGGTATQGGFPDAPSPVSRITCPNALPPRLFAGGKGRVSGGGVYMRREPSVDAGTIMMVTGDVFDVLSGPNCDPTGIAWWEVGIGGLHGWMAESNDGVYLLEPVLH